MAYNLFVPGEERRWRRLVSALGILMTETSGDPDATTPLIMWGTGAPGVGDVAPNGSWAVRLDPPSLDTFLYVRLGGAWSPLLGSGAAVAAHQMTHADGGSDPLSDVPGAATIAGGGTMAQLVNDAALSLVVDAGSLRDVQAITFVVDGGVIYADVEKDGTGDITVQFDTAEYDLDCTTGAGVGGKARVALTAGTATVLQKNYICITEAAGTVTLAASTSYPTGRYALIGTVSLLDAAATTADGAFAYHRFRSAVFHDDNGKLQEIGERIRQSGTSYDTGVDQTLTVATNVGALDNVVLTTTTGSVWQFHRQEFSAQTPLPKMYILNHPTTPYLEITDLNEVIVDASGGTLRNNNDRYGVNIVGIQNSEGIVDKLGVLLPTGRYRNNNQAINDRDNKDVVTVPYELRTLAFRICRVVLRYQTVASGTLTNLSGGTSVQDRRGFPFGVGGGAGSAQSSEFDTAVFRLFDPAADQVDFGLSALTAPRTITMPDEDVTLVGSAQPLDADLTAIAALASAADKMPYSTGAQTWALADLTAFARTLLDDANQAAAQATLGITNGSTVTMPTVIGTRWAEGGLVGGLVYADHDLGAVADIITSPGQFVWKNSGSMASARIASGQMEMTHDAVTSDAWLGGAYTGPLNTLPVSNPYAGMVVWECCVRVDSASAVAVESDFNVVILDGSADGTFFWSTIQNLAASNSLIHFSGPGTGRTVGGPYAPSDADIELGIWQRIVVSPDGSVDSFHFIGSPATRPTPSQWILSGTASSYFSTNNDLRIGFGVNTNGALAGAQPTWEIPAMRLAVARAVTVT